MKRQLQRNHTIEIIEISSSDYGNPLIARGAFGEVSIAIQISSSIYHSSNNVKTSKDLNNDDGDKKAIVDNDIQTTQNLDHKKQRITSPSYVVMKTIRNAVIYNNSKSSHEFTPAVFTELASLRALTPHPNITPLLDIKYNQSINHDASSFFSSSSSTLSSTSLSFIFPYCPMDLQEIISYRRKKNLHLHKSIIQSIIYDICTGLEYCHSKGILHCDIKPGNVVLSSNGIFQLADFGIARTYRCCSKHNKDDEIEMKYDPQEEQQQYDNMMKHKHPSHQLGLCTLYYRPPELLYGSTTFLPSLDMWGVGLIIAELCTLRPLFPGASVLDQLSRIMDVLGTATSQSYPELHTLPDYNKVKFDVRVGVGLETVVPSMQVDLVLANLIDRLVVFNPNLRLSATECLNHSYLHSSLLGFHESYDKKGMTQTILETLIFNNEVLADVKYKDANISKQDELLEEMKTKGAAIAQARRKLSSFKSFDLQEEKSKCIKGFSPGLGSMLAKKMTSGNNLKELFNL
jgi:serine/threonine protein kinase